MSSLDVPNTALSSLPPQPIHVQTPSPLTSAQKSSAGVAARSELAQGILVLERYVYLKLLPQRSLN